MSISKTAALFVPVGVCLGVMSLTGYALSRYAPAHYLPEQKMAAAIAAGDQCVLVGGDSRMAAAFDGDAIQARLQMAEGHRCLADVSIGATDASGWFLAVRKYLSSGRRPSALVIGIVADGPLLPTFDAPVGDRTGNNAIHLTWTRAADVRLEVPGFPAASIEAFDDGFRFLVARLTPLGKYQSLFWKRLSDLDAKAAGTAAKGNQFGELGQMAALESQMRQGAVDRLATAMRSAPYRRWSAWFVSIVELADRSGAPLVLVELPMPSSYRHAVTDTQFAAAYRDWLRSQADLHRGGLLDLSHPGWLGDDLFIDNLHLGKRGAELVSSAIGTELVDVLRRTSAKDK
jgi:hypothetical protein